MIFLKDFLYWQINFDQGGRNVLVEIMWTSLLPPLL